MQIEKQRQGYKLIQIQSRRYEEIPNDWNVVTLKNLITDIKSGFASGARDENGVIQLRMNNITDYGTLDFSKILKVPIPEDIDQYDLKKDDVLFNNTNSLDLIGKTTIVDNLIDHTFSNHITRIRTDKTKLVPYFLMLLFLKYKEQAIFRSICNTHVGQSGISKNELLRLKIICPPLIEQQKIASILSYVDYLINQTQKIVEQTQRLKKGILEKLLTKGIGHTRFNKTKLGEIPEEWKIEKLENICKITDTPHYTSPLFKDGIPVITTADCDESGRIDYTHVNFTTREEYQKRRETINPEKDDVLFTREAPLGIAVVVDRDEIAVGQRIILLKLDKKLINNMFLITFLNSARGIYQSNSFAIKTTVERVNISDIKKFVIPLPSILEQQKISNILSNVDLQIQKEQEYKSNLETLKKGLMQKLLTGQIRVKV